MRVRSRHGAAAAALIALGAAAPAAAEPLPPGSLGMIVGAASGTGVDANRLGFGYQIGGQAAWQPMATENRLGWALKSSVAFGTMYDAGAASVGDTLKTLHMDLMLGVRVRPGVNPSRYLTLRAGGQLLRANQVVPPSYFISARQRRFQPTNNGNVRVSNERGMPRPRRLLYHHYQAPIRT
jgi:hypothetical protein